MKPDERQVIKFKVTRDSGYRVRVIFESGAELERTLGYVTNGFDYKNEIWIEPTDMTIKHPGPSSSAP